MVRTESCAAALVSLKKKIRVRYAIQSSPKAVLSRAEFISMCTSLKCPSDELMTAAEVSTFLDVLHGARVVLLLEGDVVHLRPHEVVDHVHRAIDAPPLRFGTAAHHAELNGVCAAVDRHDKQAAAALVSVALRRKRFWSAVALGSGAQMCVLSYLTFVHFDWDVMEPACFFVSAGTSIFFYLYLVVFRREHSLQTVDENLLPRQLDEALRASSVDVPKWAADAARLQHLECPSSCVTGR